MSTKLEIANEVHRLNEEIAKVLKLQRKDPSSRKWYPIGVQERMNAVERNWAWNLHDCMLDLAPKLHHGMNIRYHPGGEGVNPMLHVEIYDEYAEPLVTETFDSLEEIPQAFCRAFLLYNAICYNKSN